MNRLVQSRSIAGRLRYLHSQSHTAVNYAATPIHPDELTCQIFGSSTEVGKTIISAGLSLAALNDTRKVCYLKPVQTGELDEYFIQLYTNPRGINDIFVRTLQHWSSREFPYRRHQDEQAEEEIISDQELLTSLQREMNAFVDSAKRTATEASIKPVKGGKEVKKKLFTIVETAGGVLSPGPNKTLQADLYRSLRLPVLLVGDARLGGISATLCAYESLRVRGYTVHAIVMIDRVDSMDLGNKSLIQEHLESMHDSIPGDNTTGPHSQAWSLGTMPKVFNLSPLPTDGKSLLHAWFKTNEPTFHSLFTFFRHSVALEWRSYNIMREKGLQHAWWPSTEHSLVKPAEDVTFVESAHGDQVRTFSMQTEEALPAEPAVDGTADVPELAVPDGRLRPLLTTMFDATASWWTQGVGHGHGSMALAIGEAAGRYGHLLFPLTLHPPVVTLSRYLVERGPGKGWAHRVFYSDSGATAIDIALKMAFKLHEARSGQKGFTVLTQTGGYHGHTLAAINTTGSIVSQHPWNHCNTVSIDVPFVYYRSGKLMLDAGDLDSEQIREVVYSDSTFTGLRQLMDVDTRITSPLGLAYREHIQTSLQAVVDKQIGALILEPLMLGNASLRFIDPLYQKILIQEAKKLRIPVIYDEVATGFYRLGVISSCQVFKEFPDIACYAKMLSGGYLSLSTTVASEEVFLSFYPQKREGTNAADPAQLADEADNVLYGHAYSGNPIACTAALEAIRLLENCDSINSDTGRMKPSFPEESVKDLSKLPGVVSAYAMGTVISIQMVPPAAGPIVTEGAEVVEASKGPSLAALVISLLQAERIQSHPLNDNIYIMCTPFTSTFDKQRIVRVLKRCLTKAYYLRPNAGFDVSSYDNRHGPAAGKVSVGKQSVEFDK